MSKPAKRPKLPETPHSAGKYPLDHQTGPKLRAPGDITQPYTRPTQPETPLSAKKDPHDHQNLAKMKGPERYNAIGQTPKTAGDASLGGQRPHSITKVGQKNGPTLGGLRLTRSPNLAKRMGPGRNNSTVHTPKTAGDASLGGQRSTRSQTAK